MNNFKINPQWDFYYKTVKNSNGDTYSEEDIDDPLGGYGIAIRSAVEQLAGAGTKNIEIVIERCDGSYGQLLIAVDGGKYLRTDDILADACGGIKNSKGDTAYGVLTLFSVLYQKGQGKWQIQANGNALSTSNFNCAAVKQWDKNWTVIRTAIQNSAINKLLRESWENEVRDDMIKFTSDIPEAEGYTVTTTFVDSRSADTIVESSYQGPITIIG